jgi:hypothetical protein
MEDCGAPSLPSHEIPHSRQLWFFISETSKTLIHHHYRNRRLCRVPEALGKALQTLGKEGSAYSASAKPSLPSTFSWALGKVVCRVPESTRQIKASVTATGDGDGVFAECLRWHSAKELPLSSVCLTALGKESARGVPMSGTLPSAWYGTWQSVCWELVLKCFELRTRQHKMLNVNVLRPLKHYLPKGIMIFGRRSWTKVMKVIPSWLELWNNER